MDSPSGRKPGSFHWASTMWHELSHVYVLAATNHRVPRWFTEGMAVYEETAVSPEWGDRLDPTVIAAIKQKKLLPVAELDRGFVHPTYPSQVVVSYFQAGRICGFIAHEWGYNKLLAMMHDFSTNTTTAEVIEKELEMKPEDFDKKFLGSAGCGNQNRSRTLRRLAERDKRGSAAGQSRRESASDRQERRPCATSIRNTSNPEMFMSSVPMHTWR